MIEQIEAIKFSDVIADLGCPVNMTEEKKIDWLNKKLSNDEMAKLCEIKADIEQRKKEFAILYYEPQPHQEPFHLSNKKVRLISGANQSGKSICASIEGIQISLGIHPTKKIPVPNKGRVIATDLQKGIGENITEQYDKYCSWGEVARIKRYPGGQMAKIFYKNGSTVDFLSYEQKTEIFEGWIGHWAQFDEPPPRDKYIATMRGLMRYKGLCWIAMTPLTEPWIYDEIYTQGGPEEHQPDVWTFDERDNIYISDEEKKDFASRLTPDEKEARLHGRFKHLSGLIYKIFSPEIHCVKSFPIPEDRTRYVAMDYHPRTPCAVLWIAVDPHGRAYVYDELEIDKTIKEISDAIKVKEGKDHIRVRFIDPLSATPDRITGRSAQREFLRPPNGLAFRSATKTWVIGKNAVEEYLKLDKEGQPGIYYFRDKVPKCISGFLHYQWDEYAGTREGEKETPRKKYAHFPDCTRYILVTRSNYKKEIRERKVGIPMALRELRKEDRGHKYTGYSAGGE